MIKAFIVVNNHGTSPRLHDAMIFRLRTPRRRRWHRVSATVLARGLSISVTDDLVRPSFPRSHGPPVPLLRAARCGQAD